MKRTTFGFCIVLLAMLAISWSAHAQGQEPLKDAAKPEPLKVESKSAPITVPADVLKKLTVLFDGRTLDGW